MSFLKTAFVPFLHGSICISKRKGSPPPLSSLIISPLPRPSRPCRNPFQLRALVGSPNQHLPPQDPSSPPLDSSTPLGSAERTGATGLQIWRFHKAVPKYFPQGV